VPDAAPPNARPYDRSDAEVVIARFEELLQERPVWNRVSLLNGLGELLPRNKRPAVCVGAISGSADDAAPRRSCRA